MTVERRLAHAGFELTREYPHPVEQVWSAFAEEQQKRAWFGDDDAWDSGEWAFDFRVGGHDVAEGAFHDGPVSRYAATYTDIVEHVRIVTTYDMWLDGVHMSTSVASLEFEPTDRGTLFTHIEHGVFLDRFHADGKGREEGSRGLLDRLERHLG
ncbi:SRPBCC domain-containing protein [Microbacterium tumbae]